nr:ABC transporter substrate-binding protein [Thauera sp.]
TFVALRDGFRAGIPRTTADEAERVATRVFDILAAEGGEALVGKARALAPGTFWRGGSGE